MGFDSRRNRVLQDRQSIDKQIQYEERGGGFAKAFQDTAGAFLEGAMPQFRNDLQLTRENAVRRGVSTGDLGTSYEGDLSSAFHRNLSNALAGLSSSGYENSRNRLMSLLSGKTGMDMNDYNQHANMWGSIGGSLIKTAGDWGPLALKGATALLGAL